MNTVICDLFEDKLVVCVEFDAGYFDCELSE